MVELFIQSSFTALLTHFQDAWLEYSFSNFPNLPPHLDSHYHFTKQAPALLTLQDSLCITLQPWSLFFKSLLQPLALKKKIVNMYIWRKQACFTYRQQAKYISQNRYFDSVCQVCKEISFESYTDQGCTYNVLMPLSKKFPFLSVPLNVATLSRRSSRTGRGGRLIQ